MKIYTKTGDEGETGLVGGQRVSKDDHRIRVYGGLDELNAILGMTLNRDDLPEELKNDLHEIQNRLFEVGAELATPRDEGARLDSLLQAADVAFLETRMDQMDEALSPLKNFILPGGSHSSGHLHFARAVVRRCERDLITLHRAIAQRTVVLQWLNRLSDYFFVAARYCNFSVKISDVEWKKRNQ